MGKKIELEKEFIEVETSFLELKNSNASDSEKLDSMNYFITCISEYIDILNIENNKLIRVYRNKIEKLLIFFKISTITNILVLLLGIFNLASVSSTCIILCLITLIYKSLSGTKKNISILFNNAIIVQYNKLLKDCQEELEIIKEKIKKNEKDNNITNSYEYKIRKKEINYKPIITKNEFKVKCLKK